MSIHMDYIRTLLSTMAIGRHRVLAANSKQFEWENTRRRMSRTARPFLHPDVSRWLGRNRCDWLIGH